MAGVHHQALDEAMQPLQVGAAEFVNAYNWSQALAAPVLASAVNSPLLLNNRLWHETRIALFQSCTGIDPAANADALVAAIAKASDGGAAMLFTPEMSGLLDRDSERAAANLRTEEDDEVLAACTEAASRHGLWLHLGSLALRTDEQKLANRGFVIDSAGTIRARYDKIHLFDVDLPTGESWRESAVYRPGRGAVVVEGTPVGRLGLTICYDLRFPAVFSRQA